MRKINVAHILNDARGLGGVPKVAYHLLKGLPEARYNCFLYSLKSDMRTRSSLEEDTNLFASLGVKVFFPDHDIKKAEDLGDLCKWLLKNQIEILHTHSSRPNVVGRLAGILCGKIKIVAHYHNAVGSKGEQDDFILDQLLADHSDRLIACSESVRQIILEKTGLPEEKMEVLFNGVDLKQFRADLDPNALKKEMKLPPRRHVIGMIGRISKEKGQADFIQAARLIKQTFPKSIFLIIGGTSNQTKVADLRKLAISLDLEKEVIFSGYVSDIEKVYAVLDLLVVPSHWEGFGLTLVEGMASGKPIVATDVGAISEVVVPGETALLVPPSSPDVIASKVIHLLKNPKQARRMGEKGQERAKTFSWNRSVIHLDRLYRRLVQEQ